MPDANNITILTGGIGKEPRYFDAKNDMSASLFSSIGVTRYRGKDNDPGVDWIEIRAYGKLAESLNKNGILAMGNVVSISGQLRSVVKETAEGNRTFNYVVADDVKVRSWKNPKGSFDPTPETESTEEAAEATAEDAVPAF